MFEDIVETVREPLIVLDSDLRVLSANRSFYDSFKVIPEETIGNLIYDLGNRQWDIPRLRTLLEDILPENNKFDDYEVEHIFSGVGHKIMLLNARRIIHKEKGSQMILLAIEDITERKRIESLLEANEAKYRELVQNVNSIILKMDPEGKVTFFNKFAQRFFDYTEKEMLGRYVVGTIVPETESTGLDLDFMMKDIEINPEKYINNENENMRRNGERVWVAWTNKAIRDGNGKVIEILCIGNDITERRRMENELKDYEERFRKLFETAKDGLLLIDKQTGNIVNVNPAIMEMLGYISQEFIGKKPKDIGLLKDIKDFKETIRELIHAGFINYEDVFAETKQGQLINVDIYLVDRARFIQCNVRDITERKQAEEALKKAHDELERRVEERTIELSDLNNELKKEIELRKQAEEALRKAYDELEEKVRERTSELYNANIALRVLLKQREEDKNELEEKILSNVRELIMPLIDELKKMGLSSKYRSYLGLLESNLLEIISPFSIKLSSKYANLTNKEILVADFIKRGQSTKEIAGILDVSKGTIDSHRNNIRKKLGLNGTKTNLRTYLSSMDNPFLIN